MDTSQFRVDGSSTVAMSDFDPNFTGTWHKKSAKEATQALRLELRSLQELLYAQQKHKILMVLQATDTGGKDGTIHHVFRGVNQQGIKIANFKQPSKRELAHDYLWRVHKRTPATGEIGIFNRSHYEDVLVVRVHNLVPEERWEKRYRQIRDFERLLVEEGTVVLKFFLNISKEEQKSRLQDRLDDPDKHWKFSSSDLKERAYWDQYQEAYEAMLNRTGTDYAPWYVIPSNKKWFRTMTIANILIDTLNGLQMTYPPAEPGLDKIVID